MDARSESRTYLAHRSNHELLLEVTRLVGSYRAITAKLVACLAEIEHRRLHLQAGFSSMFEFCVKLLGFSEGEAYRRLVAARLFRRFPIVYELLESGKVHLSALELLRDHVTDENHRGLFEAVSGMSKRGVEAVVATRFPKPDVPSRITRGRVEPLSETRFRVEFTANAELREKLELCRDLMSHANPSRDLAAVVERAVDLLIEKLEGERLARLKHPARSVLRTSAKVTKPGRIARATRREVFERDGRRCTYVSPEGRRCEARAFLELDHAEPRALGGHDVAENLRVRCRAHNQLAAEQVFGREHVEQRRYFRQRKYEHGKANRELETVRVGLRRLGFGAAETCRAVAELEQVDGSALTLEEMLRNAVLAATRAA